MIALVRLQQLFLDQCRAVGEFPPALCADGPVPAATGLAIYANAYGARLREALETDHPVLGQYLGDELWADLCAGYIADHPSRQRSLRQFGDALPGWLASHEPFAAHPLVAELARFERALLDVFDAADGERLDWSAITGLDANAWPGLRLHFHPSARVLDFETAAVEAWRALKDGQPPPAADAPAGPARLLWRDTERISRFRPLDGVERQALGVMLHGAGTFAELCEVLAEQIEVAEVPGRAIEFLRRWFDEGIVSALNT